MSNEVVASDVATDAPTRGRGRPARKAAENASNSLKQLANSSNSHSASGEPSAKRGRGRPKKPNAKPKVLKKPGGGRGRPKKNGMLGLAESDANSVEADKE